MQYSFEDPLALILLFLLPLIVYLYRDYVKKRKSAALRFSSIKTLKLVSPKKNIRLHLPFVLVWVAICLIILGLADPHIPRKTLKEGVNVILVIDDSGSMAASDYKPTRLEAAKRSAESLILDLNPKDNVGIVVFESGASTVSYLTPFKDKAITKLKAIKQKQGRTALGDGLGLAVDMAASIPNKKKVIILLSDGVNNAGAVSPKEAIDFAKLNKIQVYTVGLGSVEPVVLGYDLFGNPVMAQLDEKTLKDIAKETGGTYSKSVDEDTLDEIYKNIGENIEREIEDVSIKDWFFVGALLTLLLNIYIIYGRYRIIV